MGLTQALREIAVETALGEDALLLRSFTGGEAISRVPHFELELASEDATIAFEQLIEQKVTLRVSLADGSTRYWNGWVSRFVQLQRDSKAVVYRATMVPWLWFLGQTTDCRIFQNKSVPDILKGIFQEYGYSDFVFRTKGDFAKREYCVQYRESDLNFVSRLMEEEGIFYYFEHEEHKHTLVMVNDGSALKPCPGQATVRYDEVTARWSEDDVITSWSQEQEVKPGIFTSTDYNFESPATNLLSTAKGKSKWETYDFPGEFEKRADGDRLARIRLDEQQTKLSVANGESNCRSFAAGYTFQLTEHYREDLDGEYLLVAVHHSAKHDTGYSSSPMLSVDPVYANQFECVPAKAPFRPARLTRVPTVLGCQTAVVVGPAGEEIFTDKYGRVKVQFHWDREGTRSENSSCWVRVSYPTAGKAWGAIQIPRIGQEVLVDFLEGNPDRPIITGRVYNAGQMPPYDLPGKGMVSGFKSNSTKGGGGYNEFAFDDTKGNELIRVHGQYDMDTKIEHDERRHVLNNRSKNIDKNETSTIGVDRTEKVGSNEIITIGANRTESVTANEQITIGANRIEKVGANETITVALTRTRNVGINEMVNIGGAQEITIVGAQALTVGLARAKTVGVSELVNIGATQTINVGAAQTISVGATQTVSVAAAQTTSIGAGQTITIASDLAETIGGGHTESVTNDRSATIGGGDALSVGKAFSLTAADEISLVTGDASIVLKKDGTITIQGKNITVKASGKINAEASGDHVLKGSKILQN